MNSEYSCNTVNKVFLTLAITHPVHVLDCEGANVATRYSVFFNIYGGFLNVVGDFL